MAQLVVRDGDLVLRLTALEKAEALHGDLRVPLTAVRGVDVLDRAIAAVDGWRSPGTGVPGLLAVGTYRRGGPRTFAVVHLGTHGGVRVRLGGVEHEQWVVGCSDPEAVARDLRAALAP